MGGEVAASLAPGFRFHPTDEELVSYYLKRKVCGKPFRFDAISEIDLYKSAPWDLPGQSRLKSRDLEWYFFCALDRKYGNGSKTNRATQQGYWKTTGKDRPVRRYDRTVGMKKTLVFHIGKAPRGERTNWVMHEYRLVDEQLGQTGVSLNTYVLCRIFQKSGSGPKNGEQYGAPLIEEEWDEDVFVPQSEVPDEAFYDIRDEGYFEQNDLEQNLEMDIPFDNIALPSSSSHGIASNNVENFIEDDPTFFIGPVDRDYFPELPDDQKFFDLSEQHLMNPSPAINEYFVELNDLVNPVHVNYLADEPREEMEYLDTSHNQPIGDISFPETDNISIPVNTDPLAFDILDEYLTYFDAIDDNLEYLDQNSFKISGHEDPNLGQLTLRQEGKEEFENLFLESPQLVKAYGSEGEGASSSKKKPESTQLAQDFKSDDGWDNNTLSKRVNRLLDSISAPPAFAAEFPTKEAVLGQNLAAQSSTSIHFTTQMIRIRNTGINGDMNEWSLGKSGDVEYILHHGMRSGGDVVASEPSVNLESMGNILSCKAGSAMVRCGLYFVFFWVLILSVSFKIGCHFYIK